MVRIQPRRKASPCAFRAYEWLSGKMTSEPATLDAKIQTRITREGPITFRDFMETALYDAELGYYNTTREKIGRSGDYYTSSNVHSVFGATLASAFAELWSGEDGGPLALLEFGAGTGRLAFDILSTLEIEEPGLFSDLNYLISERSPAMRGSQRRLLEKFSAQVRWIPFESESNTDRFEGIVFSNELVDAMPVHLVRIHEGRMEEGYVDLGLQNPVRDTKYPSRAFTICWRELSNPTIGDYLSEQGIDFSEGQILEVNLEAISWLECVSRILSRGFLVTIDYGDIAAHLYGRDRVGGTLRSFSRHCITESPLSNPGQQDITSSVNFSALIKYGERFGFETVSFERQSSFLLRNRLLERAAGIVESPADTPSALNSRLAIKNLLVEGGSSDNFRVLVQRRTTSRVL